MRGTRRQKSLALFLGCTMHFDFDDWSDKVQLGIRPARSANEVAEEAAWIAIEESPWCPTPQLFFALKEVILDQMKGG